MTAGTRTTLRVDDGLLARVLSAYKPHCRYLTEAHVDHPAGGPGAKGEGSLCRISGTFAIPESCYIDDTGHLNSVEVNICYNQMLYTLFAQGVVSGLIPAMAHLDLDTYLARQLPDVLIHKLDMSFKRVIDPRSFSGWMTLENAAARRSFIVFPSRCRFWDEQDGLAEGRVRVIFDERAAASAGVREAAAEGSG